MVNQGVGEKEESKVRMRLRIMEKRPVKIFWNPTLLFNECVWFL